LSPRPEPAAAEPDGPAAREHRDAVTQRVRVGITGLATVFLLTLLAAAIYSFFGTGDQHATLLANGVVVANAAGNSEEPPKEPLAELGVAPGGNVPKTPVTPAPGHAPAANPAPAQPQPAPPQTGQQQPSQPAAPSR
jgi:hypothetical protein